MNNKEYIGIVFGILVLVSISISGAAASPNAYITNSNDASVSVIDTATNTVINTIPVGDGPFGVTVNPAGTSIYVANEIGNTVSVIDATTNTVTNTISVGYAPIGFGQFIG